MKTEVIKQYAHTWRTFAGIVRDFDGDAWLHTGRGIILPVRLTFHILKSTMYYIEDTSTVLLAAGKPLDGNWETIKEKDFPSQNDILAGIDALQAKTEQWLSDMDFDAENKTFGWAGATQFGVALFLLRHTLYHIGELNTLL
ncbi:MAG TPA: hypothetical protein VLM78_01165, partial [Anaerolineales bacterium]|nr:hypothetical protein [Anaerolineales bacterium]